MYAPQCEEEQGETEFEIVRERKRERGGSQLCSQMFYRLFSHSESQTDWQERMNKKHSRAFIQCGWKKLDKADDVCLAYISSMFSVRNLNLTGTQSYFFTLIYLDSASHEATPQVVKAFTETPSREPTIC